MLRMTQFLCPGNQIVFFVFFGSFQNLVQKLLQNISQLSAGL